MSAAEVFTVEHVRELLHGTNNDLLAEVLKLCAAEMLSRKIEGYELIRDVAYSIHERESGRRIEGYVLKALQGPNRELNQP